MVTLWLFLGFLSCIVRFLSGQFKLEGNPEDVIRDVVIRIFGGPVSLWFSYLGYEDSRKKK